MQRRQIGIYSQHGNALWFVLLAVVLFGALAATLSRNTGSVNQAGDIEQARIKAAAILRYSTSIKTAVENMLLSGTSQNDISFTSIDSDHENTNCTDDTCDVFSSAGGGLPYKELSSVMSEETSEDWIVSAQNFVYLAGCDDADNSCTDLLLIAPDIPLAICMQINTMQGITNTDGAPPQISNFLTDEKFGGTYTSTINSFSLGGTASNEATEVQGKNAACIMASDTYYFYQLLIAR